ncbi:MAG: type II toxin-antitoxin system VapC family toxin [Mycobacterium sp.]|nr:type II toxin-antitoxin system VapC family toxin [Mycobacterium sp.]
MIALDASVIIAHLNRADPHHEAATDILLGGTPGQMLVHTMTLAEVLVGGVRIGQGASIRADLRSAGIMLAPSDGDEPLRLAELRVSTGLKLPDCCVLDVAIHHRAMLATFDATMAEEAHKRGVALART